MALDAIEFHGHVIYHPWYLMDVEDIVDILGAIVDGQ